MTCPEEVNLFEYRGARRLLIRLAEPERTAVIKERVESLERA